MMRNCLIQKKDTRHHLGGYWRLFTKQFIWLSIVSYGKCVLCGDAIVDTYEVRHKFSQYPYMESIYGKSVCWGCLYSQETDFISDISDIQLPLFINHIWVTYKGQEEYISRLKGVSYGC